MKDNLNFILSFAAVLIAIYVMIYVLVGWLITYNESYDCKNKEVIAGERSATVSTGWRYDVDRLSLGTSGRCVKD